jgi:BolA family transcriptional regulator, general stress-responsive regulator
MAPPHHPRYTAPQNVSAIVVRRMAIERAIEEKLVNGFAPSELRVVNESHLHEGHAGSPGGGESHFSVLIVSEAFAGKSRLERHRLVNAALAEEIAGGIHALAIRAMTPGEFAEARRLASDQQRGA